MTPSQFLEALVSLSLQVAVVVGTTYWVGRRVNEKWHCRLWTNCYVLLLLLAGMSLVLPHPRLFHPWNDVPLTQQANALAIESHAGQWLLYLWIAGALGSFALWFRRIFVMNRFLKTCRPIDNFELGTVADEFLDPAANFSDPTNAPVNESIGDVQFLVSRRIGSPFCWQFHRPYVVLPEFLLSFERQQLQFVLRHELEHLRTGHPLQLFLQRVVEVVYWFHPVVWFASQRTAASREFACDNAALNSPKDVSDYLKTLLLIVEMAPDQATACAGLNFGRGRSVVAERARRLVDLAQGINRVPANFRGPLAMFGVVLSFLVASFLWVPIDAAVGADQNWTPWPTWSAEVAKDFGLHARDFELDDRRRELIDELNGEDDDDRIPTVAETRLDQEFRSPD